MLELRYIQAAEVRMEAGEGNVPPKVVGYASVFNSLSHPLPKKNGGSFREIVRPGAFTRCLNDNPNISLLVDHEGLPLGNTRSKTLTVTEDSRGLRFESVLDPSDPDVQRVVAKLRRGDMGGCSFGFNTRKDAWRHEPANGEIRELHDVDCFDISLVGNPAYPAASADLRSFKAAWRSLEQWEHQQQTPADVLRAKLDLVGR